VRTDRTRTGEVVKTIYPLLHIAVATELGWLTAVFNNSCQPQSIAYNMRQSLYEDTDAPKEVDIAAAVARRIVGVEYYKECAIRG
jgi:hypothetical protein